MTKSVNTKVWDMIERPLEKYDFTSLALEETFTLLFCQYKSLKIKKFTEFVFRNEKRVNEFIRMGLETRLSAEQIRKRLVTFDPAWTSMLARYFVLIFPELNGRFKFRTPFRLTKNHKYMRLYSKGQREGLKKDHEKYQKYLSRMYKANLKTRYGDFSEAVFLLKKIEREISNAKEVHAKSEKRTRAECKVIERCDVDYLERTTK